jgi:class 3 adenylate cyclase
VPEENPDFDLTEALQHLGSPGLLEFVRSSEPAIAEQTFFEENRPRLAGSGPLQPRFNDFANRMWELGWAKLLAEFAQRLAKQDLHLVGTMRPEAKTETEVIPGQWASEMIFYVTKNVVSVAGKRYVAVRARSGLAPDQLPAKPALSNRDKDGRIVLTSGEAAELADDTLLMLLEEHGRRVVENGAYPLVQPSRVSFGPILARRMEWRAGNNQLATTLSAECVALVDWLETKIKHHQTPTARGIEDPLRDLYRRLKAGSTPGIA